MKPCPKKTELCAIMKTLRSMSKEIYIAERVIWYSCLDPKLLDSMDQVSFISKETGT